MSNSQVITIRVTRHEKESIEAEARRQRTLTGDNVTASDIIRALVRPLTKK